MLCAFFPPTSSFARPALLVASFAFLVGCSNMTDTQQRVLSGAAIGTAAGAATIAVTGGCVSCGAAVGGAVGAGAGYLYDYGKKNW